MKATEQYFHVVLFMMLYKVGLTFKSVDETRVFLLCSATQGDTVQQKRCSNS